MREHQATSDPTAPYGVEVAPLDDAAIAGIFADVFGAGRRCALLDELDPASGPQWLIAELGDARITGYCPQPGETWRLESSHRDSGPPAADRSDAWRILEIVLFTADAQIRIGEGAEVAHSAVDAPDPTLPDWLQPRDRSFLLLGWVRQRRHTTALDGDPPMTRGRELSGSMALHPVEWRDFGVLRGKDRPAGEKSPVSAGSWLRVREYWAQDLDTGAVHVAFHRLTGYHTGPKPTDPIPRGAPSALEPAEEEEETARDRTA